MADFINIKEVMDTTNGMVAKFKDERSDDGTFVYDVSPIFNYKGIQMNKIYISANSWIGFNNDFKSLKINQRDGQIFSLYLQEGTFFEKYKFFKIRWEGYSKYNSKNKCSLKYEVFFINNGAIFIHMIEVPVNYFEKSYIHDGKNYVELPISQDSKNIVIVQNDKEITVKQEVLKLAPPFMCRYLIGDKNNIYTIEDDVLKKLNGELSSKLFAEHGLENCPNTEYILGLENPSIYYWQDSNVRMPKAEIRLSAMPFEQVVETEEYSMTDETIKGIEKVYVDASDDIRISISKDGGENYYINENGEWVKISENSTGMSKNVLEELSSDKLNDFFNTDKFKFRIILYEGSYFKSIKLDYLN